MDKDKYARNYKHRFAFAIRFGRTIYSWKLFPKKNWG